MDRTKSSIWITGVGAITPVGASFSEASDNLLAGRSGVRQVVGFDVAEHPCRVAGQVLSVPCPRGLGPDDFAAALPLEQYVLWCSYEALHDSGLWDRRSQLRVGVVLGLGAEWNEAWDSDKRRGGSLLLSPIGHHETIATKLVQRLGLSGPKLCVAAACASGNHALAHACDWLRLGIVDVCIAGACDAGISQYTLASFGNLRALSRRNDDPQAALRPFDRHRDGMVLGEGGAVFLLEHAAAARRRGANAYAEVAGVGVTSDAYHMVIPSPDPAPGAAALRLALANARVEPHEVDYINAHATGTPVGDVGETRILHEVFGESAKSIPVSSTKSMTGHLLSAAAAVEALACLTAIHRGAIPPTINLDDVDPECDLNHVANQARQQRVRTAVSNSFGFGGNNTSLVLRAVA